MRWRVAAAVTAASLSSSAFSQAGLPAQLILSVPGSSFDYKLAFQKEASGGFGSRLFYVDVKRSAAPDLTYRTKKFAPGRYVLKYVMQQNAWIGCLEDSTFLIDLKPGSISYLGVIDPRETLLAIQSAASTRGELRGGGGQGGGIYHDVPRPLLTSPTASDLPGSTVFAKSRLSTSISQVTLADVSDYTFRRPDNRNRLKKDCG